MVPTATMANMMRSINKSPFAEELYAMTRSDDGRKMSIGVGESTDFESTDQKSRALNRYRLFETQRTAAHRINTISVDSTMGGKEHGGNMFIRNSSHHPPTTSYRKQAK